MINLMPPEERRQLAAARTNTILLRYTIIMGVLICVIILELLAMYFVINLGKAQNESTISSNTTKTQQYLPVQQQADTFNTNLKTAKYILSKQTPYTDLITSIANCLPKGAVINTLELDPATFGTPTTLTVMTTSYQKAIDIKTSLQNAKMLGKTPLFTSVSFQSISQQQGGSSSYPFTAIYNITYSKEALKL